MKLDAKFLQILPGKNSVKNSRFGVIIHICTEIKRLIATVRHPMSPKEFHNNLSTAFGVVSKIRTIAPIPQW